jgi:hypothetical protein
MATTYKLQSLIDGEWIDRGSSISPNADKELIGTDTGLVTGRNYTFRFLRNIDGTIAFSNTVSATTKRPAQVSSGDPITELGTFEFDGATNTIARSSNSTVVQFNSNAWRAVGITYDPGTGALNPYIAGTPSNATLSGFTTVGASTYLEKAGARAVRIKLPATADFGLTVATGPSTNLNFTITAV